MQELIKPSIGSRVLNNKNELLGGEIGTQIRELLEQRGVLVFPEIHFTDEEQVAFTKTLGTFQPEPRGGDVFKVTLDTKENPSSAEYLKGSLYWHLDGTMNDVPILASLLAKDSQAAGVLSKPHHPPKAKAVIFLFMAGGPSQLDMFTPKPMLNELSGKPIPQSFIEGKRFAFLKGTPQVLGTPHKFGSNLNSDELQWRCLPGAGTLSSAGEGEWFATLTLMPEKKNPSTLDLGLKRRYVDADEKSYDWVPLMSDVAGLKFEYYSQQLNAWLDRWNDQNTRPRLVRMWMWRTKDSLPEQAVFTVKGIAFSWRDLTWMKWMSSPSIVVLNWGRALSVASTLRQS